MIISTRRNYIFVHIPKTGGTSMAHALERRVGPEDILIGDTPKARKRRNRLKDLTTRRRIWKHSGLGDIGGLITPAFLAGAFVFTMVRNPWDRTVSWYHWLREQRFSHPFVTLARESAFSDFLGSPLTEATFRHFPSIRYVTTADGSERCDLFIRLEHFEQDAAPLWRHLGFRLDLPHENASDRARDYRAFYTDAEAERIATLYADDIRRFGYRF